MPDANSNPSSGKRSQTPKSTQPTPCQPFVVPYEMPTNDEKQGIQTSNGYRQDYEMGSFPLDPGSWPLFGADGPL